MRFFSLIYNGFVWGLLVAVMATSSLWLDMRIKVGLIIPAVILISVMLGFITKNKMIQTWGFTVINLVGCSGVIFFLLGAKRMAVLPASIIRETINMTSLSFSAINWGLAMFLSLGLIVIWRCRPRWS